MGPFTRDQTKTKDKKPLDIYMNLLKGLIERVLTIGLYSRSGQILPIQRDPLSPRIKTEGKIKNICTFVVEKCLKNILAKFNVCRLYHLFSCY